MDPKKGLLIMEYIDGLTAKERIINESIDLEHFAESVGVAIAKLHSNELIHGDLTTSNILIEGDQLALIDFGLACVSTSLEDRAVDLYVLERAILSTHPTIGSKLFKSILKSYGQHVNKSAATLTKLAEVQRRGRKREMIG